MVLVVIQIEEEEQLIVELKKIDQRKKEREKKTQDLQKLITAADSNLDSKKTERKQHKKKVVITKAVDKNVRRIGKLLMSALWDFSHNPMPPQTFGCALGPYV